jgi:hypothetical protein
MPSRLAGPTRPTCLKGDAVSKRTVWTRLAAVAAAALLAGGLSGLRAQSPAPQVAIDPDDIGGVVAGPRGPEAGVWVIAETDSLPTKFRKIAVTDDQGRFVLPDLPRARYRVWVRGYGLVDSKPVAGNPGRQLRLAAVPAPTPQAAAQIYPPNYWYSLLAVPPKSDFPGTGEAGNGIPANIRFQAEWVAIAKLGCVNCHQMGDPVTRTLSHLKGYKSSVEAWEHRLRFGQREQESAFNGMGRARALKIFADWTDRIAAGEVPPQPPRPRGVERNVVLTMWEWGAATSYIHDMVSTDKRRPTTNPNGMIYGVDFARDYLTVLDPVESRATAIKIPVRENPNRRSNMPLKIIEPSPFWGEEIIWNAPGNPHNPMMDGKGRVWITHQIRDDDNQPAFCKQGSSHPSARFYPLAEGGRQVAFFDPKAQRFTLIDTCFNAHHLQFDDDRDDTLYLSGSGGGTIGWINTRLFDESGDAQKAQGWCPIVLDTNGDGKAGPFTVDPTTTGNLSGILSQKEWATRRVVTPGQDLAIRSRNYGLIVNRVDHSVWAASPGPFPGMIVRVDPKTCVGEAYEPPFDNPAAPALAGSLPRGIDVDRNGIIWTALAGSGHSASFDRRKCKVLNGRTATGQHCPEGWTLYPSPGPQFKGVSDGGSGEYHYYNWVDQFDAFGLGENVPITNGTNSDSLLAILPKTRDTVILRVPYPVGFFTRGLDGRIDDPKTGWKGRGLWANNATNTVWHVEGGKGTRGSVVHFQLRPNPLAR